MAKNEEFASVAQFKTMVYAALRCADDEAAIVQVELTRTRKAKCITFVRAEILEAARKGLRTFEIHSSKRHDGPKTGQSTQFHWKELKSVVTSCQFKVVKVKDALGHTISVHIHDDPKFDPANREAR